MFFMVTASFFIVCSVSATRFDGYYQYGTVTSTVADSVFYNDLSISAGTESYFDVSFTFGQVSYYNSTMQQITVGSATYSTNIGILEVSCSEPTVDISFDESNRVHCFFQNDYSGDLQFSIKYYIRNTFTGGSPHNATMQSITMRRAITTHYGSMMHSFNGSPSLGVINDKLNQILSALGESPSSSDFLGSNSLIYFDNRFFERAGGGASFTSSGLLSINDSSRVYVLAASSDTSPASRLIGYAFEPGTYIVALSYPGIDSSTDPSCSVSFSGVSLDLYDISLLRSQPSGTGSFVAIYELNVKTAFAASVIYFDFNDNSVSGLLYGGIARASTDYVAGSAINPDQSGLVSDVDDAGQQQQAQEEQLWTNINSYKGDLTFNIDDWSEAAGGLSYVSGIFMSIWNNSPTQIIILSLMLGIAMLSIGRGVHAAVRVSRNRNDD